MRFLKQISALLLTVSLLVGGLTACVPNTADADPEFQDLMWAVGTPLPEAEDFVVSLPDGASVRFAEQYTYPSLGDYQLKLIVTNAKGKESEYTVRLSLVNDLEPPTLTGAKDLSIFIGDGVSYRTGVTVQDNCDGKVKLDIDASAERLDAEGSYPVIYTATDAAGNKTVVKIMVWVYRERVTEAMLYEEVDRVIASKISSGATKQVQVTEVYDYVNMHISYGADSDKTDWVRAAYDGLRTGQGDCFTYFALSKAFFTRLGIESMDVKRTEGISVQRHYWNYVNIGTKESPRWYHFDACPIKGEDQRFGLLLTVSQVEVYTVNRTMEENGKIVSRFFYAYDKSLYPSGADEIINPYV